MEEKFRIGRWTVWPQRDRIAGPGGTVHVTPKSMGVLECLVRAQGEVVARNDILDTVWPGANVTDDVLTHCITELRKAFGDSPQNPEVIETIPRKGLRLMQAATRPDDDRAGDSRARPTQSSADFRIAPVIGLVIIAGLVALFYGLARDADRSGINTAATRTIAVMPFEDMSEKQDQQFLADGLSEELALRLSLLDGLEVVGPRSAQVLTGDEDRRAAVGQVASEFVLDGSVRRSGGDLRIVVDLIDTHEGVQVWTHAFDRDFSEIFDVQDRVAEAVAVALSVELEVGHEEDRFWRTSNPAAYDELLRGNQYFDLTYEGLEQAARHYTRATAIDPNYVWAWVRLAQVYNAIRFAYEEPERSDRRDMAKAALARALELDPESHLVLLLATEVALAEEDFMTARHYYDRAIENGAIRHTGTYATISSAHVHFGMLHGLGYVEESIELLEAVYRLRPYNRTYAQFLPNAYLSAGRYEEALAEVQRGLAEDPANIFVSHIGLSVALSLGRDELVLDWLERVLDQMPARPDTVLHEMYRHFGDRDAALRYLRTFSHSDGDSYYVLQWASYYEDYALALDVMRRHRDRWSFWMPLHAPLRRTDGFKDIVRDMGLVDYWREFGWGDYCRPVSEDDFECV